MATSWVGFRFVNVPQEDYHRFYRALKDYGLAAYEVDDLVFAECKGGNGQGADDDELGDIVPIVELLHRSIPYLQTAIGQKAVFLGIRVDDDQVAEIERHATTREGKVNFDEIHQKVRSEEGQVRILRNGEQPSEVRESGGGAGEGDA